jgi:quinol monooxygenase YgiN
MASGEGMPATRRQFVSLIGATAAVAAMPAMSTLTNGASMFGLIGNMKAVEGQREALVAILLENIDAMPGCLGYVVAEDPKDPDGIWISEVWDSADSHKASLSLPSVREAIERARPLIAGFGQYIETRPVGGHGLDRAA